MTNQRRSSRLSMAMCSGATSKSASNGSTSSIPLLVRNDCHRAVQSNNNAPSSPPIPPLPLHTSTTYLLDISRGKQPERVRRNAELVRTTGIIYATFPGAYGLCNTRRIHCALDAWVEQHCGTLDSDMLVHQVKSILQRDDDGFSGGLWMWNGHSFTPMSDKLALRRLVGRLRDAKRRRPPSSTSTPSPSRKQQHRPGKHTQQRLLVPTVQSFHILVPPAAAAAVRATVRKPAPAVRKPQRIVLPPPPVVVQQQQDDDNDDTAASIQRASLLPDLQSLGESHHMDDDMEGGYDGEDTDDDQGGYDEDEDDDSKSAVSSITTVSWIGKRPAAAKWEPPPPIVPPPLQRHHRRRQADMTIDCQDPEAVSRQAEVNCLRVVCQNLRERVRYLELQQHYAPAWLFTDEELVEHCVSRLQHPYLLQQHDADAAVVASGTAMEAAEESSLPFLPGVDVDDSPVETRSPT